MTPAGDRERRAGNPATLRRVVALARPHWPQILALFLLSMLATPLALLTPLPLKVVVDNVLGDKPLAGVADRLIPSAIAGSSSSLLMAAVALLVAVALATQLQFLAVNVVSAIVGERLVLSFRSRLFRHAQRLSLAFHDTRGTAHSVYRIQYDAPAIRHLAIDATIPLLTAITTLVAMIVVMFRIDWQLALVALAVSPALFLLARAYRYPLRRRYTALGEIETRTLGVVQEVLTAVRVVKAFGAEEREQERFLARSGEGMSARVKLAGFEGWLGVLLGLTTAIGSATVLYIGALRVEAGAISLGDLVLVMAYLAQLYAPLEAISGKLADVQGSLSSMDRALGLLEEHPDVVDDPNGRRIERARGDVSFRDVWFSYDPERPVIEGVSFDIPAGARVGIAGTTGAGKSTIMSLLARFYDPDRGQVLLDGADLRAYRLEDLRNQFSIVLQDPMLLSTSIADNIAYGRPDASPDEVVEAARAANAHDFIMRLPEGYDTEVGERGMRLSGGERQRISLARAFIKDAPILILDEPTSAVDIHTESLIMEAMERLMTGRTTFMIAHRLSTLDRCTLRLHVEQGQIVDIQSNPEADTQAGA